MATSLTARIRRHILDVDITFDLDTAPVTVLFGPSGAGKTTLLRCLAGLDRPEPGSRITIGDQVWNDDGTHVPTHYRRVGYLFQDHALFPHLGVDANVAYGLHHLPRRERPTRIRQALTSAGAAHLSSRPSRQLSGGEAQRVALARALAPNPQLLLLDEPLSALDGPTRTGLRTELRQRLLAAGVPALVVTHDRTEALTLGDQVAVLIAGTIRQVGPITEVFSHPTDADVAAAVETETVVEGTVTGHRAGLTRVRVKSTELLAVSDLTLPRGTAVLVCIRAEAVALQTGQRTHDTSPRNQLQATVTAITSNGPLVRIDLDAGFPLAAYITHSTLDDLQLVTGGLVTAAIKASGVHLVPRTIGR